MAFRFNQGDRPLPGYTILRGVGRGGFGEVYYATSDGGKEVALKYLRENPAIELRGVQHCLNLKSPHLVALHDIKQNADGDFFVIMEFVHGPSLRDLMNEAVADEGKTQKEKGKSGDAPGSVSGLGPQKAAYLVREIAKGLAYLHDRGIVHRDLKPGNIFYEDGYVKIGDYGLAKLMAASQHSGQTVSVGTVHYMAPEVGSGNYDRTIDIYALGVILYEMLLGRVPFAGATMGEVLMKHLTAQPVVDELPAPFPAVIRKALAKDPNERYQTVHEMIADLYAVEAIDQSVAAFEPASLSVAAGRVAARVNATVRRGGSGGHGVETLAAGVAVLGTGSSNPGAAGGAPLAPPIIQRTPPLPRLPVENHEGTHRGGREPLREEDSNGLAERLTPRGGLARLLVALLLAVGISVGLSLLRTEKNQIWYAAIVFLQLVCILQAVLGGVWLSFHRNRIRGILIPRLLIATLGWLGLQGVANMGEDLIRNLDEWANAIALVMLFGDWAGRLYKGRQGMISTSAAINVALAGLVAGAICGDGIAINIAAICAAGSVLIQAIGGMWPMRPGEVVPRTSSDDAEEDEEEMSSGQWSWGGLGADGTEARRHRGTEGLAGGSSPAVSVELADSVADRGGARAEWKGTRGRKDEGAEDASSKPPAAHPPRIARHSGIRSLWLLTAGIILCGGILFFVAPATGAIRDPHEQIGFTLAGIGAMHLFAFAFTRVFRRYRIGLWRGVFRPLVFFVGAGMAAVAGAAWGMFSPRDLGAEGPIVCMAIILIGAMLATFVWLVPIGAYQPLSPVEGSTPIVASEYHRRQKWVRNFKWVGGLGIIAAITLLPIFGASLSNNDFEEVSAAVVLPMFMISSTLLVIGLVRGRALRGLVIEGSGGGSTATHVEAGSGATKKGLTLPLRRSFDVDIASVLEGSGGGTAGIAAWGSDRGGVDHPMAVARLFNLMDTHLMLAGFQPQKISELMRSYTRGRRFVQFWDGDIRRWSTKLNVAIYERASVLRVTCHLDVEAEFVSVAENKIQVLVEELDELRTALGGTEDGVVHAQGARR